MSVLDLINNMRSLNALGTGLSAGGKFLSAFGSIQSGNEAAAAARFRAEQLRILGGQAQASSQRTAFNEHRSAEYLMSDALAKAAASGGGASDPTVINLIAGIAQEGAYREQVALYQGDEKARAMNLEAEATMYEGKSRQRVGLMNGVTGAIGGATSLLKGFQRDSSLFQRFGGDGPPNWFAD